MFLPGDVDEVARRYGLGADRRLTGTVERGEQGQVWQLETELGLWAIKTSFELAEEELDGEDAAFQMAAHDAGVPVPAVVLTGARPRSSRRSHPNCWKVPAVRRSAKAPKVRGSARSFAAMHRVPFTGRRPEDPWYTEPVGAPAWDRLIEELIAEGAPFAADMAAMRDGLVEAESVIEPARELCTCHRDLWADNLRPTASGGCA
jgi:hypothetical protein